MRHLIFLVAMITISTARAQEVPCQDAISAAAADWAPHLSGGRCSGFQAVPGSLKPYGKRSNAYSIKVQTPNGSCSNNIWVELKPNTCRVENIGLVEN